MSVVVSYTVVLVSLIKVVVEVIVIIVVVLVVITSAFLIAAGDPLLDKVLLRVPGVDSSLEVAGDVMISILNLFSAKKRVKKPKKAGTKEKNPKIEKFQKSEN